MALLSSSSSPLRAQIFMQYTSCTLHLCSSIASSLMQTHCTTNFSSLSFLIGFYSQFHCISFDSITVFCTLSQSPLILWLLLKICMSRFECHLIYYIVQCVEYLCSNIQCFVILAFAKFPSNYQNNLSSIDTVHFGLSSQRAKYSARVVFSWSHTFLRERERKKKKQQQLTANEWIMNRSFARNHSIWNSADWLDCFIITKTTTATITSTIIITIGTQHPDTHTHW